MSRPASMKVDGTVYWTLMTYDADGILVDADSNPLIDIRKNGSPILDVATVVKRAGQTGIYDYIYNPSGEVEGDCFLIQETATVSGQSYVNSWSLEVEAIERGTDGANTVAPVDVSSDVSAILADTNELQQNQNNWLTATTTVASNMRGTDNALLATSAPTNWSILSINGSGQVDATGSGSGGDSASTIYSYFTASGREDVFKADISGLATQSSVNTIDSNVDAILADTADLQANQGNWITAVGFATPADVLSSQVIVTSAIDALNDFDPAVDTVARVALVDTTTDLTNQAATGPTAQEIVDAWGNQPQGVYTTPDTLGFYLDAQVSSAGSGGTGLYQATVRVQGSNGDALQGARVNVDGTTLTMTTGTSGEVTFNLDSGVYLMDVSPPAGYDTPVSQVVTITSSNPATTIYTLSETDPDAGGCTPPWIG